ncbi:DUF998 domain-containing protein [Streptomyces sp. PCS3-D2]|uniref:DUF998 domain-containing protein n=1 Tax=Streptomyces sp. PCS3-D2 TaxID=1460244 RepID=UPI00044CD607|nr:DUF998 domain-containing protein [Streptomyces sp. PCS3-D2]WKV70633.1 DUF998 domain-containing protein [Streptomyces sp. PCS3-D2]
MTSTLNASRHAAPAATTSHAAARRWLVGGIVAGPVFLAAGVAQGVARDGFNFSRNALSQLALGPGGWAQTVNFLLAGTLLVMGAVGLRQVLGGTPGGTVGPALVGVFGASFWAAAVFPADAGAGFPAGAPDATVMSSHGALHMAAGMAGYLALCAALIVLAGSLSIRGHQGWAVASRLVPIAVLAGFAASTASVLAFTAGAALGLLWLTAMTTRLAIEPVTR